MNIKTIIARFLPLLDVTVVLLGLMVILMSYAHFNEGVDKQDQATDIGEAMNRVPSSEEADKQDQADDTGKALSSSPALRRIIYLRAHPDGSCSRLGPYTGEQMEKIDTESDKDIRPHIGDPSEVTWLLLIYREGDESWGKWNPAKINSINKNWGLGEQQKLFELMDVPF